MKTQQDNHDLMQSTRIGKQHQ